MNKHEEARKVLNKFRNAYYNAIFYEKEKEVANALNEVLPYLESTEKAYEELKQDVKRYFEILDSDMDLFMVQVHEYDKLGEELRKVGNE